MSIQQQELQADLIRDVTELRYELGRLMNEERAWSSENKRFSVNYYGRQVDRSPFRKDMDACLGLIEDGEKALAAL